MLKNLLVRNLISHGFSKGVFGKYKRNMNFTYGRYELFLWIKLLTSTLSLSKLRCSDEISDHNLSQEFFWTCLCIDCNLCRYLLYSIQKIIIYLNETNWGKIRVVFCNIHIYIFFLFYFKIVKKHFLYKYWLSWRFSLPISWASPTAWWPSRPCAQQTPPRTCSTQSRFENQGIMFICTFVQNVKNKTKYLKLCFSTGKTSHFFIYLLSFLWLIMWKEQGVKLIFRTSVGYPSDWK